MANERLVETCCSIRTIGQAFKTNFTKVAQKDPQNLWSQEICCVLDTYVVMPDGYLPGLSNRDTSSQFNYSEVLYSELELELRFKECEGHHQISAVYRGLVLGCQRHNPQSFRAKWGAWLT